MASNRTAIRCSVTIPGDKLCNIKRLQSASSDPFSPWLHSSNRQKAHEAAMRTRTDIVLLVAAALCGTVAARGEPKPDPSVIITGQVENDSLSGTDRNYTSGVRLGITLPTGNLPGFASDFG